MVLITEDLIRKRSEHNELMVSLSWLIQNLLVSALVINY